MAPVPKRKTPGSELRGSHEGLGRLFHMSEAHLSFGMHSEAELIMAAMIPCVETCRDVIPRTCKIVR